MALQEVVKLEDVWVAYDGECVLEGINLTVAQNDLLSIIGPNGSGKTTLLKVIAGLIKPAWGSVRVFGENPEKVRSLIGYVPQRSHFDHAFPISVWEVVLTGRLGKIGLGRRLSREDREKACWAMKTVEIEDLQAKHMGSLSLGQQQRVFIARALVTEPKLLLLDEPAASVDAPGQAELYELLTELKKLMAIVLVTHDIGAVSTYMEKIACLNRKLFYHHSKEIIPEELEATYRCPVDMIAHGVPHRILKEH